MTTIMSQLREAVRGMLIPQATAQAFDDLAMLCGFPRPYYISRDAWRKALLAGFWGKRGSRGCAWAFLEGALSDFATTITVRLDPAFPSRIWSPTSVFAATQIGRLIRIPDYGLFRISGSSAATGAAYLELLTVRTLSWDVPDWSTLDAAVTITDATLLAFDVHEPTPDPTFDHDPSATGIEASNPALYWVFLFPDTQSTAPPTYMQDGTTLTFTVDAGTDVITTESNHQYSVDDAIEFAPRHWCVISAIDAGTNTFTAVGHGKNNGDEVQFATGDGGYLPLEIDSSLTYTIAGVAGNDFTLTLDGVAVDISDVGGGTMYLFPAGPDTLPAGLVESTKYLVETVYSDMSTQLTAPSNNRDLPQDEIFVEQTAGMATSGTAYVTTSDGVQTVKYTDITDTSLLGCSGGTGTMATGGSVYTSISFTVKTVAGVHVDITDTGTPTSIVMRARPGTEVLGGEVQEDVSEYGNVFGDGPYPPYLIGTEAMPELALSLRQVVPATTRVKVRMYRSIGTV